MNCLVEEGYSQAKEFLKTYDSVLDAKGTAQKIISHVDAFLADDPWFMKALDDVAKIHPFVSGMAYARCFLSER